MKRPLISLNLMIPLVLNAQDTILATKAESTGNSGPLHIFMLIKE